MCDDSGEEEHQIHKINKYWPLPGNYLQGGSYLVPWLGNVGRQMPMRAPSWYQIAPMRSFVVMANGRRPPTTVGKFGVGWGRNSGSRSDGRRIRLVGIDFNESWARDFCTVDQHWFRDSRQQIVHSYRAQLAEHTTHPAVTLGCLPVLDIHQDDYVWRTKDAIGDGKVEAALYLRTCVVHISGNSCLSIKIPYHAWSFRICISLLT
ncbi:hypothetical protein BJ166DRAFT_323419 [Pestalotiopsis sp. NC0098]|nr:hypothetical protein BJ166DRAFT_323419 [Pestalotiopsis sp. NC0098]